MAQGQKQKSKNIDNTGFGANSAVEGGRLVNADGSINLKKVGMPFWQRISVYHSLLRMKAGRFFLSIMLFYTAINVFFASVYYLIGVQHLSGIDTSKSTFEEITAAFFFSSQTLTTVGYGHVAPNGLLTNIVASTESLLGILAFAVVTGLIYGRFSRPKAYLLFSNNMLIAPYKEGRALMIRIATYKNNHLTDVDAQLTVALHLKDDNGQHITRFYPLPLEISKLSSLALSWTLVHAISEDSPLASYTEDDFANNKIEVLVYLRAFDDHFSNTVQQRTSYTHHQLVYGARFLPMFGQSSDGSFTVLSLDKINAHQKVA